MPSLENPTSAADRLRSPLVLAATLVLAAAVAAAQSSVAAGVLRAVMVAVLVPCSLIDLEQRRIPNRITGPGAVVALGLGLVLDAGGEPKRLLWAAIAGGFLLVSALIYPAGMGMGDVKLLAMMGLFLGRPVILALFVALIGNLITGVGIATRRGVRAARKTAVPFGPYLAAGGLVAAFVGEDLIRAYLKLHG